MFCFNLIGVSHYHLVVLALINWILNGQVLLYMIKTDCQKGPTWLTYVCKITPIAMMQLKRYTLNA